MRRSDRDRPAPSCGALHALLFCAALLPAARLHATPPPDEVFCSGFDTITLCPGAPAPFLLIPNRASTQATTALEIYVYTIPFSPSVDLLGPSNQVVPLAVNGQDVNRIEAVVPSGLAAGMWSVRVTSAGQSGTILSALHITDTQTLALSGLSAPAVSNQLRTRITLSATDPPPPASEGFAALPEIFLQPTGGGTALRVTDREFVSAAAVLIWIPPGYVAGSYDVIAINPDGSVGRLPAALNIVGNLGPRIDKVMPQTAFPQSGQSITLSGELFGASPPIVAAACFDSMGNPEAGLSGFVGTANASSVTATFDFSTLANDSLCRIDLTTTDGLRSSFANLPIVSTSNIGASSADAGQSLLQGRRGGVLLAGPAAPEGRRLYMIGGDGGTTATALASIESAGVGDTGALTAFRAERYALPQPLTFAGGATVGDYLYIVGGNNGTAPVSAAYRARVLRDLRSPDFISLGAAPASSPGGGVGAGLWGYRIAPLFPGGYADNPNGEGLPGAQLSVELPALTNGTVVTLSWDAVAGASGYAIYRSPSAGAATFEQLAVVASTIYSDTGTATNPSIVPLPSGSLANWVALPSLGAARQGAGVATTKDPLDASKRYLYAIAGNSSATTAIATDEFLPITIAFDGTQTNSAWTLGSTSLGTARQHLAAWTISADDTPLVTGGAFVYAGPGVNGTGISGVLSVDAGQTAAGGDLGAWSATPKDVPGATWGAATAQAREYLFLFGGGNGVASNSIRYATVTSPAPTLTAGSWNSVGVPMLHGRIYAGAATANGFIYIAGGQTDVPSPADTSIERIVQ